jgi:hypothetical protein
MSKRRGNFLEQELARKKAKIAQGPDIPTSNLKNLV